MSKYVRKFTTGARFTNVHQLVEALLIGKWVVWRSKPYHASFMAAQSLSLLAQHVRCGTISRAIVTVEYRGRAIERLTSGKVRADEFRALFAGTDASEWAEATLRRLAYE